MKEPTSQPTWGAPKNEPMAAPAAATASWAMGQEIGLLEAVGGDDAPEPLRIGAVLDAGAGIGVGVDQGEGLAPVAHDRDVLRVAGEAHQQDVARRDLGNRLRHEVLLAERPELLAVGDAAVGAGVEVEQAELLPHTEDQPAAVHGDALEPALVAPGRAEPGARRGQDLGDLNSGHRGSSAPGRSRGRAGSRGS